MEAKGRTGVLWRLLILLFPSSLSFCCAGGNWDDGGGVKDEGMTRGDRGWSWSIGEIGPSVEGRDCCDEVAEWFISTSSTLALVAVAA